jgi:hypothetical protein
MLPFWSHFHSTTPKKIVWAFNKWPKRQHFSPSSYTGLVWNRFRIEKFRCIMSCTRACLHACTHAHIQTCTHVCMHACTFIPAKWCNVNSYYYKSSMVKLFCCNTCTAWHTSWKLSPGNTVISFSSLQNKNVCNKLECLPLLGLSGLSYVFM